jgi:hypothetical protein
MSTMDRSNAVRYVVVATFIVLLYGVILFR